MSIDIKKLQEKDIGRIVIYTSKGKDKREEGVITSWNDKFIFVRYGAYKQSAATMPEDLEFAL